VARRAIELNRIRLLACCVIELSRSRLLETWHTMLLNIEEEEVVQREAKLQN